MNPDKFYAPHKCSLCNGHGKYMLGKICVACKGQGSVLVYSPAQRCALCRGLGTNNLVTREPCSACGGTGWAHSLLNDVPR